MRKISAERLIVENNLTSKEVAVRKLCNTANVECMMVQEVCGYEELAAHFGITRADYYNDYDALTEEAKKHIMHNWKPNAEDFEVRLENLTEDLERESNIFNGLAKCLKEQEHEPHFVSTLQFYRRQIGMFLELADAVEKMREEKTNVKAEFAYYKNAIEQFLVRIKKIELMRGGK